MSFGMYQASIPGFIKTLNNLTAILDKAERYVTERKIDPDVLLTWRIAPDMFPLTRQIQLTSDFAKSAPARLAGKEVPKYPDEEKTFAELKARIAKTLKFVEGFTAEGPRRLRDPRRHVYARRAKRPLQGRSLSRAFRAAELLFPRHDRLRHHQEFRRRDRQARFSRHLRGAGQAVVPELSEPRSRNAINRPAPKPPICAM